MSVTIPVTFQIVVNCYPEEYHLFQMNYNDMPCVWPGMLLIDVPGVPNIVGPIADFDNRITRLAYSGKSKRMLAQIGGIRSATDTLEEIQKQLPEWEHIRKLSNVDDRDQFAG